MFRRPAGEREDAASACPVPGAAAGTSRSARGRLFGGDEQKGNRPQPRPHNTHRSNIAITVGAPLPGRPFVDSHPQGMHPSKFPATLGLHPAIAARRGENSLFFAENSLLWLQKFPVPLRREFLCKALNLLPEMARKSPREAGFREIPDDKTSEHLSRRCRVTACSIAICSRLSRDLTHHN